MCVGYNGITILYTALHNGYGTPPFSRIHELDDMLIRLRGVSTYQALVSVFDAAIKGNTHEACELFNLSDDVVAKQVYLRYINMKNGL